MRDTISEMQNNLSGTIRLGAITSMSPVLPIILQRIRKAYPLVSVDVRFVGNEELQTGLDNFSIDCGITYMDQATEMPWCDVVPIFEETWSLLVRANSMSLQKLAPHHTMAFQSPDPCMLFRSQSRNYPNQSAIPRFQRNEHQLKLKGKLFGFVVG